MLKGTQHVGPPLDPHDDMSGLSIVQSLQVDVLSDHVWSDINLFQFRLDCIWHQDLDQSQGLFFSLEVLGLGVQGDDVGEDIQL